MVFAVHKYADKQMVYCKSHYPFSGNFWLRRKLIEEGRRFDSTIEWHPKNRICATETAFFKSLTEAGYEIVYCPEVIIGHKITDEQLTVKNLFKRAYSCGRGIAHIRTFCGNEILTKNPTLWYLIRYAAISKSCLKFANAILPLAFDKPEAAMYAMQWLGFNMELINMAKNKPML